MTDGTRIEQMRTNLEHGLTRDDPSAVARTLSKFASAPRRFRPSSVTDLAQETLWSEIRRLRSLLTENTAIRRSDFMVFAAGLYDELAKKGRRGGEYSPDRISTLFEEYLRSRRAFRPLSETTLVTRNGWGSFLFCRTQPEEEFFLFASGETQPVLVHFDQWLGAEAYAAQLATRFADRLKASLAETPGNVVLVRKELGPVGPRGIWDRVRSSLPGPYSVYRFDQASGKGEFETTSTRSGRYLVLYDLVYSGDGLRRIESHLRDEQMADSVKHIVLYDYSGGPAPADGGLDIDVLFDHRRFPDLRPARLRDVPAEAANLESPNRDTFARRELSTLDPQRPPYRPSRDLRWALSSDHVRTQYAGRWIAVNESQVLAHGATYGEVYEATRTLPGSVGRLLCFIPASDPEHIHVLT